MACVCPHCKQTVHIRRPQASGRYKFTCTSCSNPFALSFTDDTQSGKEVSDVQSAKEKCSSDSVVKIHRDNDRYATIGGLIEKHRGFFGKDKIHPLHLGSQFIGRANHDSPSDISIDDNTVSRQSLVLTVTQQRDDSSGATFSYSLKVNRAKNPVLHNGEELRKGEEIILHIDDVITIGRTKLTLK